VLAVSASSREAALQLDLLQRLRAELEQQGIPVARSQRVGENRRVIEDHLLMVVQFLAAMGWVMLAVGGLGLLSTLAIGVVERTREIGVLRAIGAGHRAILALVTLESLAIALLAWLAALPLSIPIGAGLSYAFGRIMFALPLRWLPEPAALLQWLALALLLGALAALGPGWRALRVPAARALVYE
jgi:putative ABC transport system permease protein